MTPLAPSPRSLRATTITGARATVRCSSSSSSSSSSATSPRGATSSTSGMDPLGRLRWRLRWPSPLRHRHRRSWIPTLSKRPELASADMSTRPPFRLWERGAMTAAAMKMIWGQHSLFDPLGLVRRRSDSSKKIPTTDCELAVVVVVVVVV